MKTCKYGHPLPEGKKYCSTCGNARSKASRERADARTTPVYLDLAVKPWRVEA